MKTRAMSIVVRRIKKWWSYSVFWDKRLIFVLGMVFSRPLAKNAVVDVIMWYLSAIGDNLVLSAIFSNILDGLSSVLKIFTSHVADSVIGRSRTMRFSTSGYIGGLILLSLFSTYDMKWFLMVMIVLLAIGTSGDVILKDVLGNVVRQLDNSPDSTEKRLLARTRIWLWIGNLCGFLVAVSWPYMPLVCAITMGISLLLFLVGCRFYRDDRLINRPFQIFFRVCRAAFLKRDLSYSSDPQSYNHDNSSPPPSTMPNLRCCRFLAHAAKITETQTQSGMTVCTLREVMVVDGLLKMLPMWATFPVVSLVSATGKTFFIEQFKSLKSADHVPVLVFIMIQNFSGSITLSVYTKMLSICKCRFLENQRVQIGVGMFSSILCCVFAWQVEVHRLKRVNNQVNLNGKTAMSFAWLIPQYCLLGIMEGLAKDGLSKFFKSQVHKSIVNYGSQYIEFVLGIGKLVSIILILIFEQKGWFGDTINHSRLDKYYRTLTFICLVNLVLYCGIAKFVYKDNGSEQEPSKL